VSAVLLVAVGCGLGALARFTLDGLVQSRRGGEFPLGTLVVNLGGAFLLGLLVGVGASHRATTVLGTAMIGSYTTFSTWMLETHRPAQDGEARLAWINIIVSLLGGLAAVALGRSLGGAL
jgi:CrcB protein